MAKFPALRDEARDVTLGESSVIIEYLDRVAPERPPLVPADPLRALYARQWDRVFDNYVSTQLTKAVVDRLRPEDGRDALGGEQAEATIARAYAMLEAEVGEAGWFGGGDFGLIECSAAPALFYANIVVPLDPYPRLRAYYERLSSRPSFARVVDEARPYRHLFPLEWPVAYREQGCGGAG